MKLIGNFIFTFFAGLALAAILVLISAKPASAAGPCPNDGDWGVTTGSSDSPGGLVVRTRLADGTNVNVGFTLSTVDRGGGDIAGYSIIRNNTSFIPDRFIKSGGFATGTTFYCGPQSDTYTGYAVFGFGSTTSNGNRWTLWCQEVTDTQGHFVWNDEEFKITGVGNPSGHSDGYWTGNLAGWNTGFTVINGSTRVIILTWHDNTNTLNVNSSPGKGIAITGSQTGTGGETSYTATITGKPISTTLDAPPSAGGRDFLRWTGCDSVMSGERCKISFGGGQTKTVTANYNASMADLVITSVRFNSPTATYLPGETVKPIITIKNQGGSTAYPIGQSSFATIYRRSDFTSCKPEGSQERFYLASLAPGASDTFGDGANEVQGFPATSVPGIYTIYVMVDSTSSLTPAPAYCAVPEGTEANNRKTARYTVAAPAGPTCSISALPSSILPGESSTLSWSASPNAASAFLSAADVGDPQTINSSPQLPSGGQAVTPTVTTTYYLTVTDQFGQKGECGTTVTLEVPEPPPSPPPPSPPPSPPPPSPPDELTLIPNPCENAVETEKLTDNYITKPGVLDPPIEAAGVELTGTLNQAVTIPLNASFTVDFSRMQSLFGYPSSDYLEGRFQEPSHKTADLFSLKPAELNSWRGPIYKSTPKLMTDEMKRRYVEYVYTKRDGNNKLSLPESADKIADIAGQNPKTITELVADYGIPFPPQPGQDRSMWLATWGKYWEKIPTSYNELYKGKLEFAVIGSEKSFEDLKNGQGCAAISARTVEFNVPDFGRTTLAADQLNQVVVPYAAQSFRDHRIAEQGVGQGPPKNFLAKAVDFCKKIISAPASVVKGLQKAIKVTLDFLSPVKPVYAQDANDGPTCIKSLRPGKEGNAPYCALPADQIQPGDSCTINKVAPNKLNPENPNDVCTFQIGSFTTTINPQNPFWDTCRDNGNGTYTCTVAKIRVYPNFRLPWIAEIWNRTLYSDAKEAGLGSVQGAKTDEKGQVLQGSTATGIGSPQVTGRPGVYAAFIPKVLYDKFEEDNNYAELERVFKACPRYFGPIPDPNAPPDDPVACEKLKTAYAACIAEVISSINLLAVGSPEFVQSVVDCVASRVGKNLSGQSASDASNENRERFVGAVDCGKHYSRDVALKPKALQTYLGIGVACNLEAVAIAAKEIPPPGGGSPGDGSNVPPSQDDCGGKYAPWMNNPLGNFGDPNCNFSKEALAQLLQSLDPVNWEKYYNIAFVEGGNAFKPLSYNAASSSGSAWGLYQMGHEAYPSLGIPRQMNNQYDRGDVEWRLQASNAVNYNNGLSDSLKWCYWAAAGSAYLGYCSQF